MRGSGGGIEIKKYYVHLFNDAFIYSQRNALSGKFKLYKAIDLQGTSISNVPYGSLADTFTLTLKGNKLEVFKCSGPEDFGSWYADIDRLIQQRSQKIVHTRRGSNLAHVAMPAGLSLAAPDGPRARCVLNFLSREMRVRDALSPVAIAAIQPLGDASRGAPLRVATVTSSSIAGEGGATVEVKGVEVDKALFDSPSGGPTKVQVQMMTEALFDSPLGVPPRCKCR